jgi:SAM-dependent methyltransferase
MAAFELFRGDALDACRDWPAPATIISDGAQRNGRQRQVRGWASPGLIGPRRGCLLRLPTALPIGQSDRVDSQQWDEQYSRAEFQWTTRPNQFVAAELADLAPGHALDLAAGEGRNAVWLAERGWRVTAVDFSRVGLAKGCKLSAARGVADQQVDWVVADLRDYQPESGAFDLVLIAYLQVGPELRAEVLARAAAALAPGGTVFVIGHDLINLTDGVGGPQDPDVLYTPEIVSAELPGLRIVRAERVRRTVEREGGPATAIDALVRAVRA